MAPTPGQTPLPMGLSIGPPSRAPSDAEVKLHEPHEQPATLSLMLSAAANRQSSFNDADDLCPPDSDNAAGGLSFHKLRRDSTKNLLYHPAPSASVLDTPPPSSLQHMRQLFAIRIIERHYTRHVRVRPAQLYLDAEKTKRAEWGKLTFTSLQHLKASSGSLHHGQARSKHVARYMRVSHESEAGRVARCVPLPGWDGVACKTGGVPEGSSSV